MSIFKAPGGSAVKFIGICLLTAGLGACSVGTKPTTVAERAARSEVDKATLFDGQEPLQGPLTLYDAIARAVKYNSEQRVSMMEQALSHDIADAATTDMLPSMAASGGFVSRSDRLAISARSVQTRDQSLEPSFVEDKNVENANLSVVYNVLDFGISYVNAKQASDRKYITEEIRRKSMQRLVHDVRTAFWKAAAAQRIEKDLNMLIESVREELIRTKTGDLENASLSKLDEQKQLLTALQDLMALRKDTLTAKAELAALMNLPPNVGFDLAVPADMDSQKVIKDFGTSDLEHFALLNRPELRIGDYEARIMEREAKKEFLRYFPGLEFGAGVNYNSNSFLYNQHWADAGIRVSWNLMNLFTRPQAIRLAEGKAALERAKRVAMTMAVLSQVNISYLQLKQSAESFEVTASLDRVNEELWQKTFPGNDATAQERRTALVESTKRLVSRLQRDFAYAEYKDAESSLFLALGVDPLPRFSTTASVSAIAQTLEDNLSRNAPRGFKEVSYDDISAVQTVTQTLGKEQRDSIKSWKGRPAASSSARTGEPVLLVPEKAMPSKKKTAAKKAVARTSSKPKGAAARTTVHGGNIDNLKLLQISSFEGLSGAQRYWQELVEADVIVGVYSPIYKEVQVPGVGTRFRTFITDTEENLKALCHRLAPHIKSCLIHEK